MVSKHDVVSETEGKQKAFLYFDPLWIVLVTLQQTSGQQQKAEGHDD